MSLRSHADQMAVEDQGTRDFEVGLGGALDAFRSMSPQEVADISECANHLGNIGFAGSRGVPCGRSRHGEREAINCLGRRIAAAKAKAGIA